MAATAPVASFTAVYASYIGAITRYCKRRKATRADRALRRREKLAQRDHERRTEGLLRLALRESNSVNSFTAADPGIFYRRDNAGQDHWARREGKLG